MLFVYSNLTSDLTLISVSNWISEIFHSVDFSLLSLLNLVDSPYRSCSFSFSMLRLEFSFATDCAVLFHWFQSHEFNCFKITHLSQASADLECFSM